MGNPSSKSHKQSTEHSILTAMRDDEQRGTVNASRKSKIKYTTQLNNDRARTSTLILHLVNRSPLPWDSFVTVFIAGE